MDATGAANTASTAYDYDALIELLENDSASIDETKAKEIFTMLSDDAAMNYVKAEVVKGNGATDGSTPRFKYNYAGRKDFWQHKNTKK